MHALLIAWGGICMLGTCQEIVPVNIGDVTWPIIALLIIGGGFLVASRS